MPNVEDAGIRLITERHGRHRREIIGKAKGLACGIGIKTTHLVRHQPQCFRLKAQGDGSRARIVLAPSVGIAVLAKGGVRAGQK